MIERTGKPNAVPEESNDRVVEAVRSLADEANASENKMRERLMADAARKLADTTKPGDA